MDNTLFNFINAILDKLKNGSIIRQIVSFLFRIWGVLILIGMVITAIMLLKEGFHEYVPWQLTITAILSSLILLGLGLTVFQICFYHAKEIENLKDSAFTLSPIFAIIIRTIGEIYALACLLMSAIMFVAVLIAGKNGFSLPHIPIPLIGEFLRMGNADSLLEGLLLVVYLIITAISTLLLFYFIAERIIVATDIATNVQILINNQANITDNTEIKAITENINPQHQLTEASVLLHCPKCNALYNKGDKFCETCGSSL